MNFHVGDQVKLKGYVGTYTVFNKPILKKNEAMRDHWNHNKKLISKQALEFHAKTLLPEKVFV